MEKVVKKVYFNTRTKELVTIFFESKSYFTVQQVKGRQLLYTAQPEELVVSYCPILVFKYRGQIGKISKLDSGYNCEITYPNGGHQKSFVSHTFPVPAIFHELF